MVSLDPEGAGAVAEHLDLAWPVRLDPQDGLLVRDVSQDGTKKKLGHALVDTRIGPESSASPPTSPNTPVHSVMHSRQFGHTLQGLACPVIAHGVLDGEHEQVSAPQLNPKSQRTHLGNRLLGLAATLRADLVPPLLRVHRSKASSTNSLLVLPVSY